MLMRRHRVPAAIASASAAALLAGGCTSSGAVADIGKTKHGGIVESLFDPSSVKPLLPNANRKAHDGGLGTGTQSLPSFDNSPLPRTIPARRLSAPYTTDGRAVTGKLFFFKSGEEDSGNYYVCSGTVIKSRSLSLVWTAGHCVHDGKGGDWHSQMVFVPAFDNPSGDTDIDPAALSAYAPLGVFPIKHAWTTQQWLDSGDEHGGDLSHDYGVLAVGRNGEGKTLDDAVTDAGAGTPVPMWFDASAASVKSLAIVGYPAAQPYDGMAQWDCQVDTVQLLNVTELGPDAKEYRAGCDLTGGASGGGWFTQDPSQPGGQLSLVSATSVGSVHSATRSWLAGPYLDGEARALYNTADASAKP